MPFNYDKIEPTTRSGRFNPLADILLAEYLTNVKKIPNQIYTIADENIPFIIACNKSEEIYGMVVVTDRSHRTPVIIRGNEAIVLESFGTKNGSIWLGKVSFIGALLKGQNNNMEIYAPNKPRQFDFISCGADSFAAIEEAFKMGDSLFEYVKKDTTLVGIGSNTMFVDQLIDEKTPMFYLNQFPDLPPEIAKYTQSISALGASPNKDTLINIDTLEQQRIGLNVNSMTVSQYAKHQAKIIGVKGAAVNPRTVILSEDKEEKVSLKEIKLTTANGALDIVRREQQEIMQQMLKKLSIADMIEMIKGSTGINLFFQNKEMIPKFAGAMGAPKILPNLDKAIKDWCLEQIHSQRDPDGTNTEVSPLGKIKLQDIAATIAVMRSEEKGLSSLPENVAAPETIVTSVKFSPRDPTILK